MTDVRIVTGPGGRGHVGVLSDQPIALTAAGEGTPLVLLHGWGQGHHPLDPLIDHLVTARRVLRPDLPGCAASRPQSDTLLSGLALLRHVDLRIAVGALSCAADAILGACDPLVPAAVGSPVRAIGMRVAEVPGAGHSPCASHPDAVARLLLESPS